MPKSTAKTVPGSAASIPPTEVRQNYQNEQQPVGPPQLKPIVGFCVFLIANSIAALLSPIQDCDEVFNYWEPTHYLNHGYGFQTWEYSPEYAIRSWAYTGLHASGVWLGRLLPFMTKTSEFYFLRIVLGIVGAACETRLYSTVSRTFSPRVAIFFMMVLVFSPGMYHASVAYLPSSFAMYTTMLGFSAFMDTRHGIKTARGIFWFALGALLGWPFAGALVLPFVLEEVLRAVTGEGLVPSIRRLLDGAARAIAILIVQVCVDSLFYRKLVCVPLNIVLYNVFSGGNKGPNIYGVEPWHFYIRNLVLNFSAWSALAVSALPLIIFHHYVHGKDLSKQSLIRGVTFVTPFYLWLGIFTLQPHKEERFMYPAYPALALNAAISLHILLATLGSTDPRSIFSKIAPQLKLAVVCIFVLGTIDLGALRVIGTMTAYSAPLNVYWPLLRQGVAKAGDNVCLGKEWYRFPSSYLLPSNVKGKFIKSEFSGLLPGEFSNANSSGLFPGTWMIPAGMNDENREDVGKYTDISQCKFLVDSFFPDSEPSPLEPNYVQDRDSWETLSCKKFLDAGRTSILGRLLWIPDLPFIPAKFRRRWGQYCLLRRRDKSGKNVQ